MINFPALLVKKILITVVGIVTDLNPELLLNNSGRPHLLTYLKTFLPLVIKRATFTSNDYTLP